LVISKRKLKAIPSRLKLSAVKDIHAVAAVLSVYLTWQYY
jgi:hypothetical protein